MAKKKTPWKWSSVQFSSVQHLGPWFLQSMSSWNWLIRNFEHVWRMGLTLGEFVQRMHWNWIIIIIISTANCDKISALDPNRMNHLLKSLHITSHLSKQIIIMALMLHYVIMYTRSVHNILNNNKKIRNKFHGPFTGAIAFASLDKGGFFLVSKFTWEKREFSCDDYPEMSIIMRRKGINFFLGFGQFVHMK